MDEYYGTIDSVSVDNPRITDEPIKDGSPEFLEINNKCVSFVHYPDCQQLSVRIPNNGWDYGLFRLYNNSDKTVVEEVSMMSRLNGNYSVLYDTVTLPPASYTMELNWKFGFQHTISFIKHEVVAVVKKVIPAYVEPVINYDVTDRNRRVVYEGNARAATIIYIDGETTLRFSSEMGGGNCLFYILVPNEEQWERYTRTPLSERDSILQFVAEAMQREQASGRRFEIDYGQITFYKSGY